MRQKLKEIAEIQMGYPFRTRLESSVAGNLAIIQMKDLTEDNIVNCSSLIRIEKEKIKEHHLVLKEDLIFRSRGLITTSAIILEDTAQTIVTAPLLRIRIKDKNKILPEYLNWYISQKEAQRYFKSRQEGATVNMISRQQLDQLPIEIPTIETQQKILKLAELSKQEIRVLKKLAQKKEQYISKILTELTKGK